MFLVQSNHTILKKLQNIWPSLDLTDLILPDIPPYLDEKSEKVLSFIEKRLADLQYLPRCDSRELRELCKVCNEVLTKSHSTETQSNQVFLPPLICTKHLLPQFYGSPGSPWTIYTDIS